MRLTGLVLLVITACTQSPAPPPNDAGIDAPLLAPAPVDAFACVHVRLDAGGWGENCSGSLCHDGLGWCIDGVCRPQCVQPLACLACEGTCEHVSPAGQCYCAP